MIHFQSIIPKFFSRALTLALICCLFPLIHTVNAQNESTTAVFSPVVNGEALRGLSVVNSAETMGAGRITFNVMVPWYMQQVAYLNTPNINAQLFTVTGAFSYGVNTYVDLFASITGFGASDYRNTDQSSGLGTIRAGVQGSLPFPQYAFLRMGGQLSVIGGTSQNQINTYRADGYNYFDTRTGYDVMGKLMQTAQVGTEDFGVKFHLNEAGVLGLNHNDPGLLLLGAGLQTNIGFLILGAELNSRTQFVDMSFESDPLWVTPSIHFRTPYQMNIMAGIDISLSQNRSNGNPRALEPYRVFGSIAFSFDMLRSSRLAAIEQKQREAREKANLENKAALSERQVASLTMKSADDSMTLATEKRDSRLLVDSMQRAANDSKASAEVLAAKAVTDSLALVESQTNLASEIEKRSEAENKLLSTGELLLDAVYFTTGGTDISINSKPYLNIISKMLLKYPKLQIEVGGHTDNIGSASSNTVLSQGRAEAVRAYLIEMAPMLSSNLSARGYGLSQPKSDNKTANGRLENRRVELRVTNTDALQEYSRK